MTNARGEAELLASTEGLELDAVDSMVTDRVRVEPSRAAVVMESAAPAATPAPRTRIRADDVTVSVSVRVAYTAADDGA